MSKTFYVQTDQNNIIRDVVEFPVDGYVPVQWETPLPIGINGGWYKLMDGKPVEVPELKPNAELEERMRDLELLVMELSLER